MENNIMDLARQRGIARLGLSEISPSSASRDGVWVRQNLAADEFPVPDLVLFALTQLLDIARTPPGDKTRWLVEADFRGVPFSLALGKFGFQLSLPADVPADHVQALLRALRRAAKLAAAPLKQLATEQIEQGNVTLNNQFHSFDRTYRFFRDSARELYGRPASKPPSFAEEMLAALIPPEHARHGSYLAGAMLEAYFSRLEHLLVLVLPFTGFDPSGGNLRRFVGDTWDSKFKTVFDVTNHGPESKVYVLLRRLMDELRNPRAHGGFQKQGASFFFHAPGVTMALPVTLTAYDFVSDVEAAFIAGWDFERLCQELDSVDAFLQSSKVRWGLRFAEAGLQPIFSTEMRAIYRSACSSEEEFELFLDAEGRRYDDAMNFDD